MCAIKQRSSRSESTRGESTSLALLAAVLAVLAAVTGQISLAAKFSIQDLPVMQVPRGLGFCAEQPQHGMYIRSAWEERTWC